MVEVSEIMDTVEELDEMLANRVGTYRPYVLEEARVAHSGALIVLRNSGALDVLTHPITHRNMNFDTSDRPWKPKLMLKVATYQQCLYSSPTKQSDRFTLVGTKIAIDLALLTYAHVSRTLEAELREAWNDTWQQYRTIGKFITEVGEKYLGNIQTAYATNYFKWRKTIRELTDEYDKRINEYIRQVVPGAPIIQYKRLRARSGGYIYGAAHYNLPEGIWFPDPE